MGFLAPWFLAGSLAVGLPIWLHLLQQHKTTHTTTRHTVHTEGHDD